MGKIGHIQCDWLWWKDSALVLFKLNSVHGYDDEDNIERDVEEEGRNRVVINNAAEEDDDDIKYEEEG